MGNKQFDRREALRLISYSGLGLFLGACSSGEEVSVELTPETSVDSNVVDTTALVNDYLASGEVSFLLEDDENYSKHAGGFNKRVVHKPKVIAMCKSTAGVAIAMKFANLQGLKVSVRSGGHSFEGFSSNTGGLVINLSKLKNITPHVGNEVTVESGVILRELYDELLPLGRLIPTGSCATVGVAGLALGGGYGLFSRKHGLTCDNMIEATMVDGQGEVHNVTHKDELMWGLRGGGNGNYGVVTEMKFVSFEAPQEFTRYRLKAYKLDVTRAKVLLKKWFETCTYLADDCFAAFVLNHKTLTVLITSFDEDRTGADKMFGELGELCDKSSDPLAQDLATAMKTYYGIDHPIYFKNASAGLYKSFQDVEGCIESVIEKVINTPGMIYQVNTLGGQIGSLESEEVSCFPHRDYGFLSELQTYWSDKQKPARLLNAFNEVQEIIYNHGIIAQYRNYPSLEFKEWEKGYYGNVNYQRLQSLKLKYDPNNIISHPQSVRLPENG